MDSKDSLTIADEIIGLYERHGGEDYIGEPISQLEHMSQSAQLAERDGYEEEVILAAFLHDIGHLCAGMGEAADSMGGFGVRSHEKVGADFLRKRGFSERLARLVESHVQAKRYLTFADPAYYEKLSEASKNTLTFQGGRMTEEEASDFEKSELFSLSIQMRQWDELAKEQKLPVVDLEVFWAMCVSHLRRSET
jgi:phosphonate degradation associated HDIG domain protein